MGKKIVFVCTGNTCRSPMAEALARTLLREGDGQATDFEFSSAGVAAFLGDVASKHALEVMADEGIELNEHRARLLTEEMLQEAHLVLTMTKGHQQRILQLYPKYQGKVFPLKEYALDQASMVDVLDPYGQSKEVYQSTAEELRDLIKRALVKMEGNL